MSVTYPSPVLVNGYSCRNCTDVDYAKRQIDPAHPRSGPAGLTAAADPTQPAAVRREAAGAGPSAYSPAGMIAPPPPGRLIDLSA